METDPWLNISKEHPKRRHPNRRALMAARRARILKMKRKMKEDQEWQPNKVPLFFMFPTVWLHTVGWGSSSLAGLGVVVLC